MMHVIVRIPTPIQKVCAKPKQAGRYALRGIEYLPGKNGNCFLAATNGHSLAVVQSEHNLNGLPPAKSIIPSEILPGAKREASLAYNRDDGEWLDPDRDLAAKEPDTPFPPCADVIPDIDERPEEITSVCLDASLLHNLAKAISPGVDAKVTLFIRGSENVPAIAVYASGGGIGVIMPCAMSEDAQAHFSRQRAEYVAAASAGD